jgi:zinc/manganese transport system permease protein
MISLLLLPFLACVSLVLVHVYFGAFVLRRGILFIDLALAQWAALGYVVGHWLNIEKAPLLFLFAFGFTAIAALILTILKPLYDRINLQEAVIGVTYIAATALATGIISSTGMEGHHLKAMFSGHLLFIQLSDLIPAVLIYAIIGGLLFMFHAHFVKSQSRVWDFVFYILFGCVVTSSVKMVGILLVFSYLVLPILSIVLFTDNLKKQIALGWVIGILSSLIGLPLSIFLDIPPSFCVIFVLCASWIVGTCGACLFKRENETSQLSMLK